MRTRSLVSRRAALLVAGMLFLVRTASADDIRVMTSGAFTAAYLELLPQLERSIKGKVVTAATSMGTGSDSIPSRLGRGEPVDVVILADDAIGQLIKDGLVLADSRVELARSSIGMAVRAGAPKPDISSLDALRLTLLRAKSIAYSASVSGLYVSTELFQRLGIADQMLGKSQRIDRERVGAVVARGEAEIGFQQISELLPVPGIDYVGPLPPEVQRATLFSAGVAAGSKNADTARALIRFLASSEAAGTVAKTGLEPLFAPITANPLAAPVEKRGLMVEIKDLVRLPETRGRRPPEQDVVPSGWARVSYIRDAPDGRRFVNDSRGFLYLLDGNNQPTVYADVASAFPFAIYSRLESGFIGFTFHPEFARNGLFYTVHGERAAGNPATLNFIPPGFTLKDVTHHNVITEWHARNPSANTFEGTRRELLRVAHVVNNLTHPMGAVEFNPTARPGSPDYGLLYTSGSDLGFSNGGGPNANNPSQTQRLDSVITAILRIDPRSPSVTGGVKGLGDYTIPAVNKFAADGDPKTLGEIYAYGFRNAHRLSWDLTDGTMFASDIGMNHIEEINIVHEGRNYGWMKREAFFENGITRPGGVLNQLYPLPAEVMDGRQKDEFTYPVAIYDHDEGRAVSGGFAYYGRIAALRGKFVFGDVQRGRLFAADLAAMKKADDGIPQTVAPVEEIQLYVRDAAGNRTNVTFQELVDQKMGQPVPRADLHIGRSKDGELFITSRQDGTIRMLVP